MDRGYTEAPYNVTNYNDGYIRTFRMSEVPVLSDEEIEMFKKWVRAGKYDYVIVYLQDPKYPHKCNDEIAEFVVREVVRSL